MAALRALPRHGTADNQHQLGVSESRFKAHIFRRVVKDVAVFKVRRSALFDQEAATLRAVVFIWKVKCGITPYISDIWAHHSPSCDVQANQLDRSARQDGDDAPRSHGVEYDASSHLRLDRQASIDAQCRAATIYLVGQQLVGSGKQHDFLDRSIVERSDEFT